MDFLEENIWMIALGALGVMGFVYLRKRIGTPVTASIGVPQPQVPYQPQGIEPQRPVQPTYPIYKPVRLPADGPIQVSSSGRWLDQTTYRLEMPPTRDIMPQFLMDPPECVKPTMADKPGSEAYWKCQYAKSEECRAKGGSVVMSAFESMGPNSWGAKYGYCVDREPPKEPTEAIKILEKRCPTLPSRCQGQACPAIYESNYSMQVFGKDPSHRHGQYQIWKCASAKGA